MPSFPLTRRAALFRHTRTAGAKTMIKTSRDRLTPLMCAVKGHYVDLALCVPCRAASHSSLSFDSLSPLYPPSSPCACCGGTSLPREDSSLRRMRCFQHLLARLVLTFYCAHNLFPLPPPRTHPTYPCTHESGTSWTWATRCPPSRTSTPSATPPCTTAAWAPVPPSSPWSSSCAASA